MKTRLHVLFSAALIAGLLAGCASSSHTSQVSGHTLGTALASDIPLPFPTDGYEGPLLTHLSFSDPVTDLDKPAVLQRFGRPAERLTPDLWIYWRFYLPEDAAENGGHDTLVVAFARGRVSGMKLVQGEVLRGHLAAAWRPRSALAQK